MQRRDKTSASLAASPRPHAGRSLLRDVVITDREGRAFDRPRRADYRTEGDYLDAYDDYRRRVDDAMSNRGMELSRERDRAPRMKRSARRDPSDSSHGQPRIVGALYYVEWDAHDEGGSGTYLYEGVYPPTGAYMFRRVSRFPKQRVTVYLFSHELQHVELVARPQPRLVSSTPRSRSSVPELRPGRVLTRSARARPPVWDAGIVGPHIAREARFQGIRRIDGVLFHVWSTNDVLYAQPQRSRA